MSDSDEDIYDTKIESNRYHIVKVLNPEGTFDLLRQHKVLTEDDVERIRTKTTRRKRAGALLDILRTKGTKGVEKFLDCLEYENPECFEKVTRRKPRPPPKDYTPNRQSILMRLLNELPRWALDIRHEYMENKDLTQRLDEMELVLQLAQKEKQEIEEENEKLKKELILLASKVRTLEIETEKNNQTIKQLRKDNAGYQHDRELLSHEKSLFKDKWMATQTKNDEIEKENEYLRQQITRERRAVDSNRRSMIPSRIFDFSASNTDEIQKLKMELGMAREEIDDVTLSLSRVTEELKEFKDVYNREKEFSKKILQQKNDVEAMCEKRKKVADEYFAFINQLNIDKEELENEKKTEQKKYENEAKKANKIFKEKHHLENKYDELKFSYDKLVADSTQPQVRLSSFQQEAIPKFVLKRRTPIKERSKSNEAEEGQTTTEEDIECFDNAIDLSDIVTYDVHREYLPPKIDRNSRETKSFIVITKTPIGEKLSIVGGNITGIFIQQILQRQGNLDQLNIGDEITAVKFYCSNKSNQEPIELKGLTLEVVKNLLSPTDDLDVDLYITRDHYRYKTTTQWMSQNESDGDFFYIRSQFDMGACKMIPDHLQIKAGDIFRVTNTNNSSHEGYWRVIKFTGGVRERGLIPNMAGARKYQLKRSIDEEDTGAENQDAVKCKVAYERVLPVRALDKMPVLFFGSNELVERVMTLLVKDSSMFVLANTGNLTRDKVKEVKAMKHLLTKGGTKTRTSEMKYVNICIAVDKDCHDNLKKLFGRDVDISDNEECLSKAKDMLDDCGITYDILTINSKLCTDKDSLLRNLQDKISKSQNRYLWLSETELSDKLLDQYSGYMKIPYVPCLHRKE